MKKPIILAASTLVLGLASCSNSLLPGASGMGTSPNQSDIAATVNEENTYLAQAIMSVNMLETQNMVSALARKARSIDPTAYDALAEDILNNIDGMMAFTSFDPSSVSEKASDRAEYQKLYEVTVSDLNGGTDTYDLYFNSETRVEEEGRYEKETRTTIRGLAVKEGIEYALSGTKTEEVEGKNAKTETELELKISRDRSNYVLIEQEMEFNENEYEYTLVENGREVRSSEYSIETHKSGKMEVSLEREEGGKEYEIELLTSTDPAADILFEIEHPSLGEVHGSIVLGLDETGADIYTLTFFGVDKTYVKAA